LGVLRMNRDVYQVPVNNGVLMPLLGRGDSVIFSRGDKLFELTNHLGNVLATISDKRFGMTPDSVVRYFVPDLVSANDYYPFGMLQPGRSYPGSGSGYRYGFNGKEKDDEVKGKGNQLDYGMRMYDSRVGRFLSIDPLARSYPGENNYNLAGNSPIQFTDFNGMFKISPFFVKRYPTLAKVLQYYLPMLKDNPRAMESWIKTVGFSNHAEGEKAFNEMVSYGGGPWITPTRPAKEQKSGWNQQLNRFFEPTGSAGEFDEHAYPENLSINYFDLDALEAAVKKGDNMEIGQQMMIVTVLIMHEASHWGKFKYNCCEVDDFRTEAGAIFEWNTFGKRFSYQHPAVGSLDAQAYNRNDVKSYYKQQQGGYGSPSFGFSINSMNDKHYWNFVKRAPTKSGQEGDPTLKDNGDKENSRSKVYVPKDRETPSPGNFSYNY